MVYKVVEEINFHFIGPVVYFTWSWTGTRRFSQKQLIVQNI